MFEIRYNILSNFVDYFVICESKYDHKGDLKKKNFLLKKNYDFRKIKYFFIDQPFPKNTDRWENQAIQREHLLSCLNFADNEDYIFFSDPDEIINPKFLKNFELKKKFGIFMMDCFNYKFNLFNPHESPWEGTRVTKKKNLSSIDYLRQKVLSKNLNYKFYRLDKEKNIELFKKSGWHFNNIMSAKEISLKLKTFAHSEFSSKKYSDETIISNKMKEQVDLFERGHKYQKINFDESFPNFLINNKEYYKDWIL